VADIAFLHPQARAILWAQLRGLRNRLPRSGALQLAVSLIVMIAWYGIVVAGAVAIAVVLPQVRSPDLLRSVLHAGLLFGFLYWQVMPVILVTTGVSLDLRRLLAYPIPTRRLFGIEVLLRLTTGIEVLLLLVGAIVGLARNSSVPWWSPLPLIVFGVFNMLLSVGVRDLIGRMIARKGIREVLVIIFVLGGAIPQVLLRVMPPDSWTRLAKLIPPFPWPWTLTARLGSGERSAWTFLRILGWTAAAWLFGYQQFYRTLRFDAAAAQATGARTSAGNGVSWTDRIFRLPSLLLPDPLGALVEKEIRSLCRAPRFRLVLLMGFTFGLVIWMPMVMDRSRGPGFFVDNVLVLVTFYAATLLGEVLFWNSLGFDRQAAQLYFVIPVSFSTVLIAKNLSAFFFLLVEVAAVNLVCMVLPFRLPPGKILESYAVNLLLCLFLMGIGNLSSVNYPRAMNPSDSWRRSSGSRFQIWLLLFYPIVFIPIGLAYIARYAFGTSQAFYGVLFVDLLIAIAVYWVALDSAVTSAERDKERILQALAQSENPVS
jgi:ABC-2 type transport system permease protein